MGDFAPDSSYLIRSGDGSRLRCSWLRRSLTFLGGQPAVTIGADGWGEFAVKDGGVSVYVPAPGIITSAWRIVKDIQRAVSVFRKKPDKKRRGSV